MYPVWNRVSGSVSNSQTAATFRECTVAILAQGKTKRDAKLKKLKNKNRLTSVRTTPQLQRELLSSTRAQQARTAPRSSRSITAH